MDQTDPWQVVPRQVFTPCDCLLTSVAFVVLCCIGCLCDSVILEALLNLKAPITTAADDTHKYFFIVFQRK